MNSMNNTGNNDDMVYLPCSIQEVNCHVRVKWLYLMCLDSLGQDVHGPGVVTLTPSGADIENV